MVCCCGAHAASDKAAISVMSLNRTSGPLLFKMLPEGTAANRACQARPHAHKTLGWEKGRLAVLNSRTEIDQGCGCGAMLLQDGNHCRAKG